MKLTGRVRRVAREILAYLVRHPEAKDSLVGIGQWWLDEPDRWSDVEVHRAVEALVKDGLLCTWESSPGSVIFGPTQQFLQTPQTFLRQLAPDGTEAGADRSAPSERGDR